MQASHMCGSPVALISELGIETALATLTLPGYADRSQKRESLD